MADDVEITVQLSPESADAVRVAVREGGFRSEQEVVETALALWRTQQAAAAVRERLERAEVSLARNEGFTVQQARERLLSKRRGPGV